MLASQIPNKVPLPFANSGSKNVIPTLSQIGITPGIASLTDGFPPLTGTPKVSGGIAPAMQDFNGIFNLITAVQQWQSAGGAFKYDAAFSTAIGGYPAGAILASTSNTTYWLNLADSNTTDPDSGAAANWTPIDAYGIGAVAGLTNANVTLTPAQYGKNILTLAGTLTGNVQIIFPNNQQLTTVANNTTGAFAVTCKTAAGTGGTVVQGGQEIFYGDGVNLQPRVGNTPAQFDNSTKLATTNWVYLAMATIATAAGFAASFAANGYIKFPSWLGGLIIQWGNASIPNAATTAITLPIAHTTGGFAVIASGSNSTANAFAVQANIQGLSQINAYQALGGAATIAYVTFGK
jgi:hypothetical protein